MNAPGDVSPMVLRSNQIAPSENPIATSGIGMITTATRHVADHAASMANASMSGLRAIMEEPWYGKGGHAVGDAYHQR
jgi:hypothetical protein